MALETATIISDLNSSNPTATDGLAQADDHIRLIKAVLQSTFPNINAAITATDELINGMDARVSALEADSALAAPTGTKLLFRQGTPPAGWLRDNVDNNKAIRVTTSSTVSTGGSQAFTSAFSGSRSITGSVTGTVAGRAISEAQMPIHKHDNVYVSVYQGNDDCAWSNNAHGMVGGNSINRGRRTSNLNGGLGSTVEGMKTSEKGGGQPHDHAWSGNVSINALAMDVQYVDIIIATKQ